MPTGSGPALTVKVGADVRDLKKGLDQAKRLAGDAGSAIEKAVRTTSKSSAAQKALNNEINQGNRLIQDMVGLIRATDRAAVQEAKNAIAAQREWMNSVGATTEQYNRLAKAEQQLEGVIAKTRNLTSVTDATTGQLTAFGRRGSAAFTAVLFGAEQLFEGTESGARSALRAVSMFAFAFGPEGVVVSALATGALALMHYFDIAEERMKKAAQLYRQELAGLSGNELGARTLDTQGKINALLSEKGQRQAQIRSLHAQPIANPEDRQRINAAISAAAERITAIDRGVKYLTDRLVAIGQEYGRQNPYRPESATTSSRTTSASSVSKPLSPILGPHIAATPAKELQNVDYTKFGYGGLSPINRSIAPMLDPKMVAAMDKVAAAEARRAAREDVLINSLSGLSANIVALGANFIAQKFGKSGAVGGALGGSLVGALGGSVSKALGGGYGKLIGSVAGSVIPGLGTIAGGLVGGLAGKVFGGLFGRHKKKVDKSADALDKLGDAAKKVNDQLLNIPTGFKVTFARWLAADANNSPGSGGPSGGGPGAGGTGGSGGTPYDPGGDPTDRNYSRAVSPSMIPGEVSPVINIETLIVHTNDPDAVGKAVAKSAIRAANRGGVSSLTYAVSVI